MWKIRELQEKVTSVVMNYTEVETKVREATNDDEWGPHGGLMQEIAQYTYQYEHFPEVMGMLWKRMFEEQRKNWRRTYKGLLLLSYLIKNGSERVVTSAREHLYDLRGLETYTFIDDFGKDQGINIRQKSKELVEMVQDDDRLREERRKARQNKDKYIGLAGGTVGTPGGGYRGGGPSSIDNWDPNKPDTIQDKIHSAIDSIGTMWKESRKKSFEDDPPPGGIRGGGFHTEDDFEYRDTPTGNPASKGSGEFHDDFEETQQIEKKTTTTTERKTTTIKHTSVRSSMGKGSVNGFSLDGCSNSSKENTPAPAADLLDLSLPSPVHAASVATAAPLQPKGPTKASVDPMANANGDFGDFSGFQSAPATSGCNHNDDFADFTSAFGNTGSTPSSAAPAFATSSAPVSTPSSNFDLLSQLSPTSTHSTVPVNPVMASSTMFSSNTNPPIGIAAPMGFGVPTSKPVQPVSPMQAGLGVTGGFSTSQMTSPITSPMTGVVRPQVIPSGMTGSTWSDVKGSVNISLDSLSPHSTLQQKGQAGPTLSQMQHQNNFQMNALSAQMSQTNIAGFSGMSLQQPMQQAMRPTVPIGGMMPQSQLGFGGNVGMMSSGMLGSQVYGMPSQPAVTSPTTAMKKKADDAFADLAVFK